MKKPQKASANRAFTLVELLVVISIIGLLIAVLVPAISAVRDSAKVVATTSQFGALDQGLEMYRGEQNLGGAYPPSAGDSTADPFAIADPGGTSGNTLNTPISGASLLAHALLGADRLGPPGFVDIDNDGDWSDDTHQGDGGAYEIDATTGEAVRTRYGGGTGFVSPKLAAKTRTFHSLYSDDVIVAAEADLIAATGPGDQLFFVDEWDRPILYYKANKAARFMAGSRQDNQPTVYRQEDNGIITGSDGGALSGRLGVDFGASADAHGHRHFIGEVTAPGFNPQTDDVLTDLTYEHSFARFIFDPQSRARNAPVRKDSYLLISPGPDAIYGNEDDVTNWTRVTE